MSEYAWTYKAWSDMKSLVLKPVFLISILMILISTITLVAYTLGTWRLVSFGQDYIPMAPLTAILFIILSIILIIQVNIQSTGERWKIVFAGSSLLFIISIISLIQGFFSQLPDLNTLVFHVTDVVAGIPVGRISPVTAGIFLLFSVSIWMGLSIDTRIRESSALVAVLISIFGLIVVIGYWYQTPLLYGGIDVPVALASGFGFLIGGYALVLLRKEDTILGVSFFGTSIQATLLRTFLPAILISVLFEGWIYSVLASHSSTINPVFWSGIIALGAIAIIGIIIFILSRQISGIIDTAENERDESLFALKKAHEELSSAYEKLKINEEKLQILADYTYDWEIWENPDGEYVYISPSCERITGYSSEEFWSNNNLLCDIVHPHDKQIWEEHIRTRCHTHSLLSINFRIIHRDGTIRWIHHICQQIILPTGENLGQRSSNRDVTHEIEGDLALKERDTQYRLITENSADVIWIYNIGSERLRYISPSVYKLRGYTPEEVLNQTFEEMLTPESYDLVKVGLPVRISRFMSGDESERVLVTEIYQTCKDGSVVPTEVVTTLVCDPDGDVIEIIGVSRDITERKEAEERISIALHQIDQNLETLAVLNDQIRNPLTIMEFISEELEGEKRKTLHEQILLIDDLIDQLDKGYLYSEKVRSFLAKHVAKPSVHSEK